MAPQSNRILAFNDPWHDSSFCFYGDDQVIHIESERFTRHKYEPVNPILVFCELFPDRIDDFQCVVFEESPNAVASFVKNLVALKRQSAGGAVGYGSMPYGTELSYDQVPNAPFVESTERVDAFVRHLLRPDVNIFFAGHHASHAANAFFSSGFASALTVTFDGIGIDYVLDDSARTLTAAGTEASTHRINGGVFRCEGRRCVPAHHVTDCSVGFAWSRVAEHVLGRGWGEEGTVMAMAALGDPQRYRKDFQEAWVWLPTPDGNLDLHSSAALQAFFARLRDSLHVEQDCFDIAAALQEATEIRFRDFLARFIEPGDRDLCLAGGTILNCQMIGKVSGWFPQLRRVFVPPAPYDGGICIGAAQLVFHGEMGLPVRWAVGLPPFAMGAEYTRLNIVGACRSARVQMTDVTTSQALALLLEGKVLGWFSGAAESGRRALGHRSIIADPRIHGIKERLNTQIKHRQWFRPFAPMILAEEVANWFQCDSNFRSPYMSFAVPARSECRARVPAIVHFDGSARVQTVHRELTPRLHAALSEWKAISGIPLLLNTSFNEREPIVETPVDALNTMKRAHLDGVFFVDVGILATPMADAPPPISKELPKCPWSLRVAGDNRASVAFLDSPERVRVTIHRLAKGPNYDIQLNQTRYEVAANRKYRLTFRGRADAVRDVCLGFSKASEPWSNLGLYRRLGLTTEWGGYSEDFVATSDEGTGRIHFDLGDAGIAVELSSVRLWNITDTGLVAVGRSERRPPHGDLGRPSPTPSAARSGVVETGSRVAVTGAGIFGETLLTAADTGSGWIVSAPNRPGAQTLPGFRMFGVLGTWMEADVVAANIRNAIAQGCERVYLVDNGSTDGTLEAASQAGATVARSFRTERYDEALRLHHMNDVVSEVSQSEGDQHIWWLFLDADEFPHGPWGMTLREYLATLDEQFRAVGTRYFNHYPSGAPHYEPGRHPLDFQPLCEELAYPMCPSRHRKHPLQRYDRGRAPIVCGNGFHAATCEEQLFEPSQPAFLHHFPFRDENITRRRLEALWAKDHGGVTRALESRDTHILTRFRSMDAVYAQEWAKVENFIALDPLNKIVVAPAAGVDPRPWFEMVEPEHQPVLRWYSPPMVGAWNYERTDKFQYGDDATYRNGIAFLDGHGTIEDWGCGFAHARAFVTRSQYVGIDGSSKWGDRITDLREYRSDTDCIFMRHVLEHNVDWRRILANAVASFRRRMALVIFTPLSETTRVIATSKTITSFPVPDISFKREDLTEYFEHLKYSEESLETDTQYGTEHVFYIEK